MKIYTFKLPWKYDGITIPPFGIFLKSQFKDDAEMIAHEMVHWEQYKRLGLTGFYKAYLIGYIKAWRKYGRKNAYYMNEMEQEAYAVKNK